jgi:hypothetical protein
MLEKKHTNEHLVTFPFAVEHSEGGLTSVFLNEVKSPEKQVTFVTTDDAGMQFGNASVDPVGAAEFDMGKVYERWFGYNWNILFDRAFTQLPNEILSEMYIAEVSTEKVGTLAHLIDYCEKLAPSEDFDRAFSNRFSKKLSSLVNERSISAVNFTDVFWYPDLISEVAPLFRQKEIYTTIHIHTSVSDNLKDSSFGRKLLRAISAVNEVFTHADSFSVSLKNQLMELGLSIPKINRFDLGVDRSWIDSSLQKIGDGNIQNIPGYDALDSRQKDLILESLRTSESVPHRFICPDRIEPTKSIHSVLKGVEIFLNERAQAGEDIKSLYRFFFLHELLSLEKYHAERPKDGYIKVIKEMHNDLSKSFPGVVWVAPSIKGEARMVLPRIMAGCHGLNGAFEDGLGLTSMEIAEANAHCDTALITGTGSGFAIEAGRRGFSSNMFLCDPKEARDFADAMHKVVRVQRESPQTLQGQKSVLLDGFIRTRKDSVIVGPPTKE